MLVYFSILLALFILVFTEVFIPNGLDKPKSSEGLYFCLALFLFMFLGFRYETGYDYDSYKNFYNGIRLNSLGSIFSTRYEPGFMTCIYLCKTILKVSYQEFLIFISILSFLPKYRFIKKYSIYPFLALLMYYPGIYLGQDFGQLRQGIAVGFCFLSIQYIYEKAFIKYLLMIILAMSFHYSAILFFPIYFVTRYDYSGKFIISSLICAIVISFVKIDTIIIKVFLLLAPSNISEYFMILVNEQSKKIIFDFGFIIRIATITLYMINRDKIKEYDKFYEIIFNIYFIGTILYCLFYSIPVLSSRGLYYYKFLDIIILTIITKFIKQDYLKILYILVLLLYCAYRLYKIINGQPESFLPYNFFGLL